MDKIGENYILKATLDEFDEFRMKKNMSDYMKWKEKVQNYLFFFEKIPNFNLIFRLNVSLLSSRSPRR